MVERVAKLAGTTLNIAVAPDLLSEWTAKDHGDITFGIDIDNTLLHQYFAVHMEDIANLLLDIGSSRMPYYR